MKMRVCLVVVVLALAACGSDTAVHAPARAGADESAPNEHERMMFSLEDAPLDDALRLLARVTGRTVAIDIDVVDAATCTIVVMPSTQERTAREILIAFEAAIAPQLRLEHRGENLLVLRRGRDASSAGCWERDAGPVTPSAGDPTPVDSADAAAAVRADEVVAGIRLVSDRRVELTARARDRVLEPAVWTAARLIPSLRAGTVVGMRLYGVRRTSVLAQIGLLNGDQIVRFGGHACTTAASLLERVGAARTETQFVIELERRGQTLAIEHVVLP